MSRLADRLMAVVPSAGVAGLSSPPLQSYSPAVTAALSRSAAMANAAARRARRPRSRIVRAVDGFVAACSCIPYALVALALRLVMARVFFLDGQTRIIGPRVPLNVHGFDFSVVLPPQVKAETFTAFLTQYAAVPLPPVPAAYLLSYAEFVLPICLVLGFGTRFAAFALMIMTAMIQIYVMPYALWSVHPPGAALARRRSSLGRRHHPHRGAADLIEGAALKKLSPFGMTGVAIAVALSLFGVSSVEPEQTMTPDALPPGDVSMAAADNPYAPAHITPAQITPAHVAPAHVAPARGAQVYAAQAYAAPARVTPIHVVPPSAGIARIIHVP